MPYVDSDGGVHVFCASKLDELCENEILLRQYRFPWDENFKYRQFIVAKFEKPTHRWQPAAVELQFRVA